MAQQKILLKLAVALSVLGVIGFITRMPIRNLTKQGTATMERYFNHDGSKVADKLKQQRNKLSEMLNIARREVAVMSCKMIEMTTKSNQTSVAASGGWCRHSSKSTGGQHMFDKPLAEYLSLFFQNQTVGSFGDGPGDYKKFLDSTHRLRTYDAFDGAPYGRETSGGVVRFADLTVPQYGLPLYDWIISLEVAEHIPSAYEDVYIDNIVRHAKKGVVLSWAVPGQGGLSHVNNRPLVYVQNLLSNKGFETDIVGSNILRQKATLPWLKANVYVYKRRADSVPDPIDA